jgi:hypothetical protein
VELLRGPLPSQPVKPSSELGNPHYTLVNLSYQPVSILLS